MHCRVRRCTVRCPSRALPALHALSSSSPRPLLRADKLAAAAHLLLRQSLWDKLLLRNPHNKLLRLYAQKKRASSYRGLWDRIDTELYLTGALIFDW